MEVIFICLLYLLVFLCAFVLVLLPVYFGAKWGRDREIVSGRQTLNSLICGLICLFFRYPGMLLVYLLPKNKK